ncbi:MAG: hypothetical protein LBT26_04215 [Clostridiales Family XIII bacterium]|nr:hypothetical protein [Clostridiales Family XIII bacterium]
MERHGAQGITFKSSTFVIIKNIIYAVAGGLVAAFIANWFLDSRIAAAIGVFLCLLIAYFAMFGDNIRIVVGEDDFTVFRRRKLRHSFKLSEVSIHAKIRSTTGDSDCTLTVTERDGSQTHIDCTMLGGSRFYRLLDALRVTDPEPVEVKTKKG